MGVPAPESLGPRGSRLWAALAGERKALGGAETVLLEEACRIADRLDSLDALLRGTASDWVSLVDAKGDPDRQEIVIDKALSEARQQQIALKQVLAELRQCGPAIPVKPGGDGAGIAGLAALIAAPAAP